MEEREGKEIVGVSLVCLGGEGRRGRERSYSFQIFPHLERPDY